MRKEWFQGSGNLDDSVEVGAEEKWVRAVLERGGCGTARAWMAFGSLGSCADVIPFFHGLPARLFLQL